MIDEETRLLILKKTWCHGQSILPIYAIVLLLWWWNLEEHSFQLVLAAIYLPVWAWYSYNSVLIIDESGTLPYSKVCTFGVTAMLAHLLVFMVAVRELSDTGHMLMMIASALLFVETFAFLLVVTAFRHEIRTSPQNEPFNHNNHDDENANMYV